MKSWIWHQKYDTEEAIIVSQYYNITHEPKENSLFESKPIFKSELTGIFKRNDKKQLGFKY